MNVFRSSLASWPTTIEAALRKPATYPRFAVGVGLFLFVLCLLRAANTGMTYDEAFTYLIYVLPGSFSLAGHEQWLNNHLLNTYLIKLADYLTSTHYNELVIRLPNLLGYLLYLYCAFLISKKFKNKFLVFSLFAFNYYLHEFFGLARGYGLSTAFVTAALYWCLLWRDDNDPEDFRHLDVALFFFSLAVLANSIALYVVASLVPLALLRLVKNGRLAAFALRKKTYAFALVFAFAAAFTFWVSQKGRPMFVGPDFYDSVLLSFPGMFVGSKFLCTGLVFLVLAGAAFALVRLKLRAPFLLAFAVYLFLTFFSNFLFGKGYPTERTLLPAYPLLVLALGEIISALQATLPQLEAAFALLAVFLGVAFLGQINITSTKDWRDNYVMKQDVVAALVTGTLSWEDLEKKYVGQPVITFYKDKIASLQKRSAPDAPAQN